MIVAFILLIGGASLFLIWAIRLMILGVIDKIQDGDYGEAMLAIGMLCIFIGLAIFLTIWSIEAGSLHC
jgi:hypothetical protein